MAREGEDKGNMSPNAQYADCKWKRKCEDLNINEPRKTCQKRINYKQLNDLFPTDLDDDLLLTTNIINSIITGDELTSLNEAKRSADWPKWEKAMQAELKQLNQMGTWELVDKPPNAVPI